VTRADITILVDPLGKPLPFSEVSGEKGKEGAEKAGDYIFGLQAKGTYNGQPLRAAVKSAACWRCAARGAVPAAGGLSLRQYPGRL
jgi:uncharacterized protein involved in outer membrane biogenesis